MKGYRTHSAAIFRILSSTFIPTPDLNLIKPTWANVKGRCCVKSQLAPSMLCITRSGWALDAISTQSPDLAASCVSAYQAR